MQAGYHLKAIEKFLELKEMDPEYSSLYPHLARAYEREEDPERGYQVLKEGIQVDEYNKDLYFYGR